MRWNRQQTNDAADSIRRQGSKECQGSESLGESCSFVLCRPTTVGRMAGNPSWSGDFPILFIRSERARFSTSVNVDISEADPLWNRRKYVTYVCSEGACNWG